MKKFFAFAVIIAISLFAFVGCGPIAEGGEILDDEFKIVAEEQPPASGDPSGFSCEQNLAFAAYKFNHAPSWETMYEGTVTAAGTNQKVRNVRQFDGQVLFAQAISVSGVKTVGEQKYFKGDDILYRTQTKIDKSTLRATWSNSVTTMSREDFFKNYGLLPNEIFKYNIDETTIISSEKVQAAQNGNYAFRFVLSPDAAKYLKNEVRTLSGAKSDPQFLTIECTIEMDAQWNVVSTSAKETYKVAIMGGIKCQSVSTETFTVGQPVTITDKAIFEAFVPGSGDPVEPPKQPIDYLSSAFANLATDGRIDLALTVGSLKALIDMDTNTGLFTFKLGSTAIKSDGKTIYVLGEDLKVKFDSLTLYETLYFVIDSLPKSNSEFTLPLDAPEILALVDELKQMLSPSEDGTSDGPADEPSGEPAESMLSRILDGMDMEEAEGGATITIIFTLDGIDFDINISVKNDKLDSLVASLAYGQKSTQITLAPTSERAQADESGAHDISSLISAAGRAIENGILSLESDDMLVTASISDGTIGINWKDIKAQYKDKVVRLDALGKKLSLDISRLSFGSKFGISDVIDALGALRNLPALHFTCPDRDRLRLDTQIGEAEVSVDLSLDDQNLKVELGIGDKIFTSTDRVAEFDDSGEFVVADNLMGLVKKAADGKINIGLEPSVGFDVPDVYLTLDISGKQLIAAMGGVKLLVSDALYISDDGVKGKLSFDCFADLIPSDGTSLSSKLVSIFRDAQIYNSGDDLVIEYRKTSGDLDLSFKAIVGEKSALTGTLTTSGKTYRISLKGGRELSFEPTDGFISLDPIACFIKDIVTSKRVFAAEIGLGDKKINALVSPDLTGGGIVAKVSNTVFYASDKLYMSNLAGRYDMGYEGIRNAVEALGLGDMDIQALLSDLLSGKAANIRATKNENILTIGIEATGFTVSINFDYSNNYLKRAEITTDKVTVALSPSEAELETPDLSQEWTPIDFVTRLVSPVKETLATKAFTVTLTDFDLSGGTLGLSGSLSVDTTEELKLDVDLTFVKKATHNIKATLNGDKVQAVYNDSIKIGLSKNALLTMLFNVADILKLDVPALDKYRPTEERLESRIIYEALPQSFRDTLVDLNDLVDKGMDIADLNFDRILYYLDNAAIGGSDGGVSFRFPSGDGETSVSITYDTKLDSIEFSSPTASGKIQLDYAYKNVVLPDGKYNFNLDSLTELVRKVVGTVDLGKYDVSGTIKLNVSLFDMSSEDNADVMIPFTLKSEILPGNDPLVYLKLEIPYTWMILHVVDKTNSYIFFYKGMMYLKSERYSRKFGRDVYDTTLYLRRTPREFSENIFDDLMFLVPLKDILQNLIKNRIAKSKFDLNFNDAFKSYAYNDKVFDLDIDLNALTGNGNFGMLDLRLGSDADKIKTFDINVKMVSIVDLGINATLADTFDGNVSFGVQTDATNSDITMMPTVIDRLKAQHSEWQ